MKRIISSLILAAGLLAPARLLADTETVGGIVWTYRIVRGTAVLGTGSSSQPAVPTATAGSLSIPSTLGGAPVTSIGQYAFYNCSGLTSVTIPEGVTSIENFAFYNCSGLTNVTIPESVTSIRQLAFFGCSGLTSVTISEGVTSIGTKAFQNCSGLTSVTIPASVTSIGDYAFYNCSGLTSVTIPAGVTSIGGSAFSGCSGLTSVTIPASVTSIGSNAFDGCSGYLLTLKTIGLDSQTLSGAALSGCSKVVCPRSVRFAVAAAVGGMQKIVGYTDDATIFSAEIVSARMRESDPTVMDVVYRVASTNATVNVRALAFENGERGFATVIRPETFIEGTDANLGDGIAANVEHTLSWRVSSDWETDLAKVTFEVLAMESGATLLPMHFVTIPAAEGHPKIIVSVNDLSAGAYEITRDTTAFNGFYMRWPWYLNYDQYGNISINYGRIIGHGPLFSALLWLYASNDPGIRLDDGVLWAGQTELVRHAAFANNLQRDGLNDDPHYTNSGNWSINPNALRYVFGKMGYRLLENADELAWVNENTRLGLAPQQFRQYAVKTEE